MQALLVLPCVCMKVGLLYVHRFLYPVWNASFLCLAAFVVDISCGEYGWLLLFAWKIPVLARLPQHLNQLYSAILHHSSSCKMC
jgi:hypothetical protein